MRRLVPQLIALAAVGIAFGVVYRYFLDDPSEASVANYLRSGVHGMSVAFAVFIVHAAISEPAGLTSRKVTTFGFKSVEKSKLAPWGSRFPPAK